MHISPHFTPLISFQILQIIHLLTSNDHLPGDALGTTNLTALALRAFDLTTNIQNTPQWSDAAWHSFGANLGLQTVNPRLPDWATTLNSLQQRYKAAV